MNLDSRKTLGQREDELFDSWVAARPEIAGNFWRDGVADEARYGASSCPTVLLLKEPNDTSADQRPWDMRQGIRDGVHDWRTWNNVARWSSGIAALPEALPYASVANQTMASRTASVAGLAIVNLKKVPGAAVAGDKAIHAFAREHATWLRAQLALYEPRITICAGSAWYLPDLYSPTELGEWQTASTGVRWRQSSVIGAIIWYQHPQSRREPAEKLYRQLVATIQEITK